MNYVALLSKEFIIDITKTIVGTVLMLLLIPLNGNKYWLGYLFIHSISISMVLSEALS